MCTVDRRVVNPVVREYVYEQHSRDAHEAQCTPHSSAHEEAHALRWKVMTNHDDAPPPSSGGPHR